MKCIIQYIVVLCVDKEDHACFHFHKLAWRKYLYFYLIFFQFPIATYNPKQSNHLLNKSWAENPHFLKVPPHNGVQ